jgi:hypothetical protein
MPENLEGVFVEGKPLEQFLEDQERDDKSRQIEDVRKQSEKRQKFTVVYGDEKTPAEDTRKVAKRVKYYSDREIRKEFGVMKKPFESNAENALWSIWEKGPLSPKEVGKEIQFVGNTSSLSAMVSTIWHRLGNMHEGALDIISRTSEHGTFRYQKKRGIDISVEQAIEKYKLAGAAQHRQKKLDKLNVKIGVKTPREGESEAGRLTTSSLKAIEDIAKTINSALGVEVKVSGRVDIVFRWER